jgi:hypothetical protein
VGFAFGLSDAGVCSHNNCSTLTIWNTPVLSILGSRTNDFCDGMSRRNFLRIGSLGVGSLSLPSLSVKTESHAGANGFW